MKATRITLLLALLLMAGGVKMQGQEYYDLEEIFVTDEIHPVYVQYINTGEMMVFATNSEKFQFIKMREDGEILGTVDYPYTEGTTETYLVSRLMTLPDGKKTQFFYESIGDTATLHAFQIDDDLHLTVKDYGGKMGDFMLNEGSQKYMTRAVVCKDGSTFIAYAPDSLFVYEGMFITQKGIRIMKFNPEGELVTERVFRDLSASLFVPWLEPTPDSLGCRLVVAETNDYGTYYGVYLNGYVLDAELNTVLMRDNITSHIYPAMMVDPDSYHSNPYNGKIYAIGSVTSVYPQQIDDEVVMSNYGKYYDVFTMGNVNITSTSQFSAYYSLTLFDKQFNEIYGNGAFHALTTTKALPVGTMVTMIDFAQSASPIVYSYEVDAAGYAAATSELQSTGEINYRLTNFKKMSSTKSAKASWMTLRKPTMLVLPWRWHIPIQGRMCSISARPCRTPAWKCMI